jgi:hypothetical protein
MRLRAQPPSVVRLYVPTRRIVLTHVQLRPPVAAAGWTAYGTHFGTSEYDPLPGPPPGGTHWATAAPAHAATSRSAILRCLWPVRHLGRLASPLWAGIPGEVCTTTKNVLTRRTRRTRRTRTRARTAAARTPRARPGTRHNFASVTLLLNATECSCSARSSATSTLLDDAAAAADGGVRGGGAGGAAANARLGV